MSKKLEKRTDRPAAKFFGGHQDAVLEKANPSVPSSAMFLYKNAKCPKNLKKNMDRLER